MHTKQQSSLFSLHALALSLTLALSSPLAQADAVSDVQGLISSGKVAEGLKKVDELLLASPGDARLRLQRGLALSLLNRNPEAIAVFQKLTETHPDMPGPYNNLAVLYANQGNFEKARQSLEQAVRYNPGYATAYQNLGDIHARLAEQAYKKALALDKSDLSVPLKLTAVQAVFESHSDPRSARAAVPAPAPAPIASPAPTPAPSPAAPAPVANRAPAPAPAPVVIAPGTDPLTAAVISATAARNNGATATPAAAAKPGAMPAAPVAVAAAPMAKAEPVKPENSAAADTQALQKAVQNWADAWSKRDMFAYLAAYTPDFKGKSATRKEWEEDRTARIAGKKSIAVSLSDMQVKLNGNQATVRFKQDYRSDALSVKSDKTLEMVKSKSGEWQIAQELSN